MDDDKYLEQLQKQLHAMIHETGKKLTPAGQRVYGCCLIVISLLMLVLGAIVSVFRK